MGFELVAPFVAERKSVLEADPKIVSHVEELIAIRPIGPGVHSWSRRIEGESLA
jgi:hypothetical protein